MVRQYKKTPGTRNYKNYTRESLEEVVRKIADNEMSVNQASTEYGIPYGTLYNRYKGLHIRSAGGQTTFSYAEEKALLEAAATCADWGFPLTTLDLRMIAKAYFEQQVKTIPNFPGNVLGIDWALSLLKRHQDEYGQRIATNIKRARAQVDRNTLSQHFDRLEVELQGKRVGRK